MVRRNELESNERDEQLGEAIETYLALAEEGAAPEAEAFAARYPELGDDLIAALDGLAMVQGLVGDSSGNSHGPGGRLESGRRIAGYRIVRELGRGGMGVVYEAVHVGLDRPVALKVLGTHAAPDSTGRRRFLNEARTAAGLHHTHIIPVFDVGQMGGICYYAMQRIEGCGLDRVIRKIRRERENAYASSASGSSLRSRILLRLSPESWGRNKSVVPPVRGSDTETGSWFGRSHGAGLSFSGTRSLTLAGSDPGEGRMELVRGREREDDPSPFDPPRGSAYFQWVAHVGSQAAAALGHAHARGVIHRDVKPSNLLVDARGLVWVGDFGLARRLADPSLTQHDSLLGTPRYMSPEQAKVGPIDGRSDLFSLGATLYELLTLRPPFEGRSAAELIEQIGKIDPIAPRKFVPRIPRDLETIVLKLLSKRAADRYLNAEEVVDDLTRFLNFEPVHARRISPIGRMWRFAQRHPGITTVSTVAAATVLAVTTVAYVKIMHERDEAIQARAETQVAMTKSLWREASAIRISQEPNRRLKGLDRIKEAASFKPESTLRSKLRNEAIEFLTLRDVEARASFPTGRARGLAFSGDGTRLVALTYNEDTPSLGFWDFDRREKLVERKLVASVPADDPGFPRRGGSGQRPFGGGGPGGPIMATAGQFFAVTGQEGQGVSLFDGTTGSRLQNLPIAIGGRRVISLLASPDGQRLVTVEMVRAGARRDRPPGPPPAPPEASIPGRPSDQFVVNLWNPEHVDAPVATLLRSENDANGPGLPLVAMSPDGKTVAVARLLKTSVTLFSSDTGVVNGAPFETQTELSALALGPDNQLATAGSGEVRLWDVESRVAMPSLSPHKAGVRLLRFSPRGSLLAIVGWQGRDIELWDTAAHAAVAVLPSAEGIDDVVFSPDGQTLVSAGPGTNTQAWAVVEPEVRVRLSGFDTMTRSMAFRSDGLLALGSWNGAIRFWSAGHCVQAGQLAQPSIEPAGERKNVPLRERSLMNPSSLAFDNHGKLITLEPDAIRVWNDPPHCSEGTRIPLPEMSGQRMAPSVLASTRDGHLLVLGRLGQTLLWNSAEPDSLKAITLPLPRSPRPERERGRDRFRGQPMVPMWRAMAVAPAGDRLYMIDFYGNLNACALEGLNTRSLGWSAAFTEANALALSPDGSLLAVGGRTGIVTLINTKDGSTNGELLPAETTTEGLVWSLAFAPDGKELAVGTQQGHIDVWSLADHSAPLVRLPGYRGFVASLAFDAKGQHLAAACSDKTVDVWDLGRVREEFSKLGLTW